MAVPMKRLIINADDFGLSQPVNAGIVQAFQEGILTSTTLLANAPAFDHAIQLARNNGGLAIGVHLNLVRGKPLSNPAMVRELLTDEGMFRRFRYKKITEKFLIAAEVEYRSQIEKVLRAGIVPTHIDFEKHHAWQSRLYKLACRVAAEYSIKAVRTLSEPVVWAVKTVGWPGWKRLIMAAALRTGVTLDRRKVDLAMPDRLLGQTGIGLMDEKRWLKMLPNLPEGTSEMMVHPGRLEPFDSVDSDMGASWLSQARQVELDALLSPAVLHQIQQHQVEMITFRDLYDS